MTDDLVKRLRAVTPVGAYTRPFTCVDTAREAADRIEQIKELYLEYVDLAEERAARIKQLEAALREKDNIAYIIDGHGITHNTFTIVYKEKSDD